MADEINETDLHAFLDGELDERQTEHVLTWLDTHPEARDRLRAYAEHKLLVAATAGTGAWPAARPEPPVSKPSGPLRHLTRAAAALALFAAGWAASEVARTNHPTMVPTYARDAVESHELFAEDRERPVEVPGSRRDEIVRWLSVKLGEPVEIPELRQVGLTLVGARLQTADGPIGQLVYEDGEGHRLTLSLAPDETEAPPDLSVSEMDGYVVGYWRGRRFAYALVAKSTPLQMAEIAVALGAPRY